MMIVDYVDVNVGPVEITIQSMRLTIALSEFWWTFRTSNSCWPIWSHSGWQVSANRIAGGQAGGAWLVTKCLATLCKSENQFVEIWWNRNTEMLHKCFLSFLSGASLFPLKLWLPSVPAPRQSRLWQSLTSPVWSWSSAGTKGCQRGAAHREKVSRGSLASNTRTSSESKVCFERERQELGPPPFLMLSHQEHGSMTKELSFHAIAFLYR